MPKKKENPRLVLGERWRDKLFPEVEGVLCGLTETLHDGWKGLLLVKAADDSNELVDYHLPIGRMERVEGQKRPFKRRTVSGRHKFKLGELYTDAVHNITGILVARTEHLTGCDRVALQYRKRKDGELKNSIADESCIVPAEVAAKAAPNKKDVVSKTKRPGPAPMQESVRGSSLF